MFKLILFIFGQKIKTFTESWPLFGGLSGWTGKTLPPISAQMPLLAPLVDKAKAARAAVGTRGYAGPDGLGHTDIAAHPNTKVAMPPGTTIARIRLIRPPLAADRSPCAFTDWLHGGLEHNPDVPILQVRRMPTTWRMSSKPPPGGRTPPST